MQNGGRLRGWARAFGLVDEHEGEMKLRGRRIKDKRNEGGRLEDSVGLKASICEYDVGGEILGDYREEIETRGEYHALRYLPGIESIVEY
ncbi:hypothetical protein PV326_012242 [Microctonus aethiopoides]|nr:hypothetical protein PV326_012242 [Microctonus aethiopoides]